MNNTSSTKEKLKKLALILLLILITIGAFVIYQLLKKGEVSTTAPEPVPTEVEGVTPLKVLSIYPQQGDVQLADTRNSIVIEFDKDVDVSTIIVETSPELDFKFSNHPDINFYGSVIMQPLSPWKENTTYKINILKGVKALYDNSRLKEDIILEYNILPIELPNYDRPA